MRHRVRRRPAHVSIVSIVWISMLWASSAWPFAHNFDVNEIFSNPDGTIQFVELLEKLGANNEHLFMSRALASDATTIVFPSNLPSSLTANKHVLIATAGFAALPGAPTPDYTLPDAFINVLADTIDFCSNSKCTVPLPFDSLSFASPLPTDGITSLGLGGATALNSPTNFAGDSGSVDASSAPNVPGLGEAGVALLIMSLMIVGGTLIRVSRFQRD